MLDGRRLLGLLLVLTGSAACKADRGDIGSISGQTGDEGAAPWAPGGADNDSVCPLSTTAESLALLEEPAELGFSASKILSFVAGSHEARVHWNAQPVVQDYLDYAIEVTPASLDEPLSLTLSHDGVLPRYRTRVATGQVLDAGTQAPCRGQLELGLTVELRSGSRALDEHWRGTLTASDASEARILVRAPTWRGRLPGQPNRSEGNFVNAQQGGLDVVDANDPGSALACVMDRAMRSRSDRPS